MSGWDQLLSIYKVASAERQAERAQRPVACPHDGVPLEQGPDGQLHCPFDGYIEK